MEALEALHGRNSAPRLTGSVQEAQLRQIIRAGLRAPDHGQLRPWRIVIVAGEARRRLGALFARAGALRQPGQSQEQLEKLRRKPLRAPLIIVVAAHIAEHPKVPAVEQILSAGAMAQNMLLAAHALGLGAMWRTGDMAYDPRVRNGLGLGESDRIVGFLYIGQVDGRQKTLPAPDADEFVSRY